MQTDTIGICSLELGGGRCKKEDCIDHSAGIVLHKKIADKFQKGETIATFYYTQTRAPMEGIKKRFLESFTFSENLPPKPTLIYDEIR